MRGARSARVLAVLLWALWSFGTMAAEEPPKARSGAEGRYVVSVVLRGGDDLGLISRQLAGTYRARLEQNAEAGPSSFMVTASATSAEQMRSDPRVVRIEAAPPVMSDAGPSKVSSQAAAGFGTYAYDGAGNITAAGGESYVYDRFGRLKSAALPGGKTQSYTYDRWGNLRTVTTSGSSVVSKFGVDESTNRIDQPFDDEDQPNNVFAEYDASGNLTKYLPTGEEFVYDGLNVLKQSKMGGVVRQFVYNASNERIAVINATHGGSEWTLRDTTGRVLRRLTKEWDGSWQWAEDYVYHGSRLLAAEVPGPEKVRHFHLDHLGTPRLITGNGGAKLAANSYYPFGMELPATNAVADGLKFTGHERDTPTLDYMHARYFNPFLGRFLSVDPGKDWDMHQPQSWNMYSYVRNNPINRIDPTGRAGAEVTCAPPRACTQAKWEANGTAAGQRAQENATNIEYAKLAEEGKLEVNRGQVRPSTQQVAAANGGAAPDGMQLGHKQALVLNGAPLDPKNIGPEYASQNMSHGARIKNAVAGLADGTKITKWNFTLLGAGGVAMTLIQARSYNTFIANQEKAHPGQVNTGDMLRWVWTGNATASPPPCGSPGGGYC